MTRRTVDEATAADVNWGFASDPEIMDMLDRISTEVASAFQVDRDDLYQEALLYAASRPKVERLQLVRYLKDQIRKHREDGVPLYGEALEVGLQADGAESSTGYGMVSDPWEGTVYPRPLVERLLEAMWNGWVVVDEFRPDGDMPRAKPNPKLSGTAMAHKIDMERAWLMADLTSEQRAALYLIHGQGMTEEAVGTLALNTYQQHVSRVLEAGIAALQLELNGEAA